MPLFMKICAFYANQMKMHTFSCIFTEHAKKKKVFEIGLSQDKGLFYERPKIKSYGLGRSQLGTQ